MPLPSADDRPQRGGELVAALAVLGAERVAGQALGVQPGEHVVLPDVAVDQGHLFVTAVVSR